MLTIEMAHGCAWVPLDLEADPAATGRLRDRAVRLRQCYREPESPSEAQLYDVVMYAWILGDEGEQVLVIFSTAFHDLSDSQLWRDGFDEMARSAKIVLEERPGPAMAWCVSRRAAGAIGGRARRRSPLTSSRER